MFKGLQVNIKKRLRNEQKRREQQENEFVLDVSFAVEDGITVLIGASGSGKTTTLRLIAGILTPDEGQITVGNQIYYDSIQNINLSIQRRRVGFVFQDYALFPHLTAAQNVVYGIKDADKKNKFEKARELFALFRLEYAAERLPHEMSGGEQQRVALARALASDPKIVLLDEPLSAVDVETRAKLLDEVERAQYITEIPFIYVTHNEAEIERLGRQRITLQKGRII